MATFQLQGRMTMSTSCRKSSVGKWRKCTFLYSVQSSLSLWAVLQVPWRFSPVEVPQVLSSTVWRTLLFGDRDRYHGFSRQWRCLRFCSSTVWRTILFGNRDRYHCVSRQWRCLRFSFRQRDGHSCLATETCTMAFLAVASGGCLSFSSSTVWRTLLFGNRDRYHEFSHQWRCLRSLSSTVLRTLLSGIRDRSRLASAANHPWTLRPECVGVDRGVGSSS